MTHTIDQQYAASVNAERADRLLDRIKIETRWLLLATPARSFAIDEQGYAHDRRALVLMWPAIRHRRFGGVGAASFYSVAADQASLFTHLIEIRRQRAASRCAQ